MNVYTHPACSTCAKATDWLNANKIPYGIVDIRQRPPSIDELRRMHQHVGKLTKLFNTSGQDYREQGVKDKLAEMTDDEAYALLNSNGMLVRRPFVLTENGGTVGFKEPEWAALFGIKTADT